jgi:pimeloyl-ACP methyl ester carboxylesterase
MKKKIQTSKKRAKSAKSSPAARSKVVRKTARKVKKAKMRWEPRRRYFVHDGLKLHYWEWGDPNEETYVFVHGVRDQGRSWDHFLDALLNRGVPIKHAVALDLRGHGDSEWPASSRGYQHEDFLTDLAGLLKHLDKEPLTIIGHSLGGSMCLLYAGAFPEKVKRMSALESWSARRRGSSGHHRERQKAAITPRFRSRIRLSNRQPIVTKTFPLIPTPRRCKWPVTARRL